VFLCSDVVVLIKLALAIIVATNVSLEFAFTGHPHGSEAEQAAIVDYGQNREHFKHLLPVCT
jgi:hypothetical protein